MRFEYFQLVDRIVSLSLAEGSVRAEAEVPQESTIFQGHFPGHPIMPGALLIETMAQTSGYLLLSLYDFGRMPFLAEVRQAKFRSFVEPGARLAVAASMRHDGSGFAITRASVTSGGSAVCSGEFTFRAARFPSEEMAQAVRAQSARLMGEAT